MAMKGLKKSLAMGSFALASAFMPMSSQDAGRQQEKVQAVQKFREIASSRIINNAGSPVFTKMFQEQLGVMGQTKVGAAVLRDLPDDINYIIAPAPEYAEEAGFWDGKNCTIYDDTLLSVSGGALLIAHETRHGIQGHQYDKDYTQMPTEQQIAYAKMMEVETRLQDVLMKEELYQQGRPNTRTYEFATADWLDYRKIKGEIAKNNPNLPASKVERMARTQFVVDTWEGNHQKEGYDQSGHLRTLKSWVQVYNEKSLQLSNRRCMNVRPVPDMTVDENLVKRHHEIMQEFIGRMGIDVPSDYFDDLRHDKSLKIIRNPQELATIGKYLDKELKLAIMPRDDFVRIGGIVVGKDNSTMMFTPEQRKELEKEIQKTSLGNKIKQAER